jgi:hypothetical protein
VTTFRGGGAARAVLYSHFRPPMAQRRQIGFASSHFTRRALQVLHPVRTLDVLSRVLFGARSSPGVMMNDDGTKGRLVIQRTAGINNQSVG